MGFPVFTFHQCTYSTIFLQFLLAVKAHFTFHNVPIQHLRFPVLHCMIVSLHSTMHLFNLSLPNTLPRCFLPFTFHNVPIQPGLMKKPNRKSRILYIPQCTYSTVHVLCAISYLTSLYIPQCTYSTAGSFPTLRSSSFFTFHNVPIQPATLLANTSRSTSFTFHNVPIQPRRLPAVFLFFMTLHSTMYLFNQISSIKCIP